MSLEEKIEKESLVEARELQVGDVIKVNEGDSITAILPLHYIYSNRKGCFTEAEKTSLVVGTYPELNSAYPPGLYSIISKQEHSHPRDGERLFGFELKRVFNRDENDSIDYPIVCWKNLSKDAKENKVGRINMKKLLPTIFDDDIIVEDKGVK